MSPSTVDVAPRRGLAPWAALRRSTRRHALFVAPGGFTPWAGGDTMPLDALPGWCHAQAGADLRVVLSGLLTHTLLADAALPLAGDDALREHARLQFAHYHGAAALHWPLAPWRWGARRGVVALHGLDLLVFAGVRLRSVEPYWSVVLRRACGDVRPELRQQDVAYLVVEGAAVTVIDCHDGAIRSIAQRRLDEATPAALAAFMDARRGESELAPMMVACGHGLAGTATALRGLNTVGSLTRAAPGDEGGLP